MILIIKIGIISIVNGTLGTTENSTFSLRKRTGTAGTPRNSYGDGKPRDAKERGDRKVESEQSEQSGTESDEEENIMFGDFNRYELNYMSP